MKTSCSAYVFTPVFSVYRQRKCTPTMLTYYLLACINRCVVLHMATRPGGNLLSFQHGGPEVQLQYGAHNPPPPPLTRKVILSLLADKHTHPPPFHYNCTSVPTYLGQVGWEEGGGGSTPSMIILSNTTVIAQACGIRTYIYIQIY